MLEPAAGYAEYLQPESVPACYAPSQSLARDLLQQRSNGMVYPSVRRAGYLCVVCFRPALVYNPRRDSRLELLLTASAEGYTHEVRMCA